MLRGPFPKQSCPACGKPVRKLRRDAGAADYIAMALIDIPFWFLFAVCIGLGMVHWVAGVVSTCILITVSFFWDRATSLYECVACTARFSYAKTIGDSDDDA